MTSLVTGATGFTGRHLVAALADQGLAVRALARDPQKRHLYLTHGEEVILGDVCDPVLVRQAVADVDVVYHCAAAHSSCSEEEIRRTNLKSVRCILEAVHAVGDRTRVILMSSLNVLGNGSYDQAAESAPRLVTNDIHVDLKSAAEKLAEEWIARGMDIVILRPGLIYGPGDPHLAKLARAIYRGKFRFIGSRDNIVPLVHVSDMVQAMMLAARSPQAAGRVYHITDGSRTTIGQLASQLAQAISCPEPKRVMPAVVPRLANSVCTLLGKPGPVSPGALRFLGSSRHAAIDRARAELGYEPQMPLAEGIQTMAAWLREEVTTASAA